MSHVTKPLFTLALYCGVLSGCSSDVLEQRDGTSVAATGAGGSGGDVSVGGSGGAGGGVGRRRGLISIDSSSAPETFSSAYAWFEGEDRVPCTPVYQDGDCEVTACAADEWTGINGGTITITGDLRTSVLEWTGTEYPFDASMTAGLFSPGSEITVDVAGHDQVAPFAATVAGPAAVVVEEPALVAPLTLDRSADLDVAWTTTGSGELLVAIASFGAGADPAPSGMLRCRYPVEAGAAAISSSALSELAGGDGYIQFSVMQEETIALSDIDVRVVSTTRALSDDTEGGYAFVVKGDLLLE